ncbi:MAG TPA: hypothetical protein VF657_06210, partial [Actinoplanes sp.]
MEMSGFAVVVAVVVMVVCVAGVVYSARWVSRYADAELEKTKRALKARHAVPDAVGASGPVLPTGGRGRVPDHRCGPVDDTAGAGRHHVPDELLRAVTYRLSQDRVARARVPQPPVLAQRAEIWRRFRAWRRRRPRTDVSAPLRAFCGMRLRAMLPGARPAAVDATDLPGHQG